MDHFAAKGGQTLRPGYTTGTCAALAARAAARMLLTGRREAESSLLVPKGVRITVSLDDIAVSDREAGCSVRKDAGDDPDATDGIAVRATVRHMAGKGVRIDGGEGVGRVTRPGLDQPVGAAAINSVPRRMIENEVLAVCREVGYDGGLSVVISIPGGEGLAAKTFNPDLGIVGGLSVIGTSGIVEPMSTRAVVDTIRATLNMLRAEGAADVVLTPGNYGEDFVRAMPAVTRKPRAKCSNFIGEALDIAVELGFENVLAVGHIGKFVKLAGGVMDTHSRVADCRQELLALHAALAGARPELLRGLLGAATVDDGLGMLGGLRQAVVDGLLRRAEMYVERRTRKAVSSGLVLFSNSFGLLGVSGGGERILSKWEETGG